jgi:hypothetical protein
MVRLLRAGLIAGVCQLGAVAVITLVVSLLASPDSGHRMLAHGDDSKAFWISISPLLKWAYILVAVGMAITISKAIGVTASHIRHASNLIRPMRSKRVMVSLASQCALSAILFGILALQTPPEIIAKAIGLFGCDFATSIIWAAALSVGVAFFGATTHAALKAFEART